MKILKTNKVTNEFRGKNTNDFNLSDKKKSKNFDRLSEFNNEKNYEENNDYIYNFVDEANRLNYRCDQKFEFEVHERTNRVLIRVVDIETKEVLKELPPEEFLDLVGSIWDFLGIFIDENI